MTKSDWPSTEIQTDGGQIKETDAIGREIFWQDLGRPDNEEIAKPPIKIEGSLISQSSSCGISDIRN